jgi:CheY-like chemotaxis protein
MKNAAKTILVIEDSAVQSLAMKLMLENRGANVLCAASGEAGLEIARHNLPDVIVLDIGLPGINGLETCRLLRADARTAKIPVILCTTHVNMESNGKGLEGGSITFLPKDALFKTVLLESLQGMKIIENGNTGG